ncbi:chlorophyllase/cutinase-like alpha/beta fold protein [Rudaea cellulosilytica]|uniref:dienelactone hydrolase family protein n=1 Tax=Rudaea cellulosilytica TaxID=540746 RepID=UPI000475FA58|nr:dienelactone hydrolase family protein [Rudaea cellulosilytica]
MRSLFVAACLTLVFAFWTMPAGAASGFSFSESPGEFGVGFKVVQQYDYARTYLGRYDRFTGEPIKGQRARPVQTLLWYPAHKAGTAMRFADYLALIGSEDDFERTTEQRATVVANTMRWLVPPKMAPAQVDEEKAKAMWATNNAPALEQRFPVVIYAPSFNASAFENADLCEYLASHGYIVIASPSLGAHGREMTDDLEGIEAQVGDIEFLVGYAQKLPDADASRIAVAGYSWGGVSNVFAAAKDDRITALVGLDGGIRYVGKLIAEAKYVTPQHLVAPYLYLESPPPTQKEIDERKMDVSDDLPARMKYADVEEVTFLPFQHYHFASEHLRFLDTNDRVVFPGTYSLEQISRTYNWMARYVLKFLDARLKGDAQAQEFVRNRPAGEMKKLVEIKTRPTAGVPPTREAMAAELGKRGFANAATVFEEMKKKDDGFALRPEELATWIDTLEEQHRNKDAVEIGKLFCRLYPATPGAYVWLADAQLANGEKSAAIEGYEKAHRLDPSNQGVAKALKKLQSEAQ